MHHDKYTFISTLAHVASSEWECRQYNLHRVRGDIVFTATQSQICTHSRPRLFINGLFTVEVKLKDFISPLRKTVCVSPHVAVCDSLTLQ